MNHYRTGCCASNWPVVRKCVLVSFNTVALYAGFLLIVLVLVKPLGGYMARVFAGQKTWLDPALRPVERFIYALCRIDAHQEMGGDVVGLCGTDGHMVHAHIANDHLGLVGEIDTIDASLVLHMIDLGYLPIIAPLGLGQDETCLNINADLVASHLAGALKADRLIFLSDVNGIHLADGSHLAELNEAEAQTLIEEGVIYGGMIPKITACLDALTDVPRVHIVDGSTPHVLLYELEDHPHVGTTITRV
jgi:Amino acid kinase family/Potassium-transporting ATPase A subunit